MVGGIVVIMFGLVLLTPLYPSGAVKHGITQNNLYFMWQCSDRAGWPPTVPTAPGYILTNQTCTLVHSSFLLQRCIERAPGAH